MKKQEKSIFKQKSFILQTFRSHFGVNCFAAGVGELCYRMKSDVFKYFVDHFLVHERPTEGFVFGFDALHDVFHFEGEKGKVEVDDGGGDQAAVLQPALAIVHADLVDVLEVMKLRVVSVKALRGREEVENFGDFFAAEVGEEDEHGLAEVFAAHQRVMIEDGGDAVEDSLGHFVDLVEHENRVRTLVDGREDVGLDLFFVVADLVDIAVLRAVENVIILTGRSLLKHRLRY